MAAISLTVKAARSEFANRARARSGAPAAYCSTSAFSTASLAGRARSRKKSLPPGAVTRHASARAGNGSARWWTKLLETTSGNDPSRYQRFWARTRSQRTRPAKPAFCRCAWASASMGAEASAATTNRLGNRKASAKAMRPLPAPRSKTGPLGSPLARASSTKRWLTSVWSMAS